MIMQISHALAVVVLGVIMSTAYAQAMDGGEDEFAKGIGFKVIQERRSFKAMPLQFCHEKERLYEDLKRNALAQPNHLEPWEEWGRQVIVLEYMKRLWPPRVFKKAKKEPKCRKILTDATTNQPHILAKLFTLSAHDTRINYCHSWRQIYYHRRDSFLERPRDSLAMEEWRDAQGIWYKLLSLLEKDATAAIDLFRRIPACLDIEMDLKKYSKQGKPSSQHEKSAVSNGSQEINSNHAVSRDTKYKDGLTVEHIVSELAAMGSEDINIHGRNECLQNDDHQELAQAILFREKYDTSQPPAVANDGTSSDRRESDMDDSLSTLSSESDVSNLSGDGFNQSHVNAYELNFPEKPCVYSDITFIDTASANGISTNADDCLIVISDKMPCGLIPKEATCHSGKPSKTEQKSFPKATKNGKAKSAKQRKYRPSKPSLKRSPSDDFFSIIQSECDSKKPSLTPCSLLISGAIVTAKRTCSRVKQCISGNLGFLALHARRITSSHSRVPVNQTIITDQRAIRKLFMRRQGILKKSMATKVKKARSTTKTEKAVVTPTPTPTHHRRRRRKSKHGNLTEKERKDVAIVQAVHDSPLCGWELAIRGTFHFTMGTLLMSVSIFFTEQVGPYISNYLYGPEECSWH